MNSAGESLASATAYATPATTPSAPQYFLMYDDNEQVGLWREAPSDDGGSAITDYEYSLRVEQLIPFLNNATSSFRNGITQSLLSEISKSDTHLFRCFYQ